MFKKLFKSEDIRRGVNPNFDALPTYGHIFYFESSKEFIKGKVVLDVGCWTGQLEHLAYKSAKKMVGIDTNQQAIAFAKKNLPDVKFILARAEKLPFSNSYFDTVLLIGVIEHVPKGSEKEVLRQIHRVLKPGGILILSTDNKNLLSIIFDPAYFLIGHRHYSMKEISKMLTETGFKIRKKRFVGNVSGLIYSIVSLFFKYTLGFEPKYLQRVKKFLLKEHAKEGFTHLYVVAETIKTN
ncbi:MAG: hypothetical protein A3A47_03935 [Candidatus Levybacteria bacterium RIFCSPLOWO2_01_FULL_37_20]|nr:MAG: hypothetical protein A3A47_03935 [Candidatus Levybacteria bacterium RIFCSPLOWO2_01_FULL_37_20]